MVDLGKLLERSPRGEAIKKSNDAARQRRFEEAQAELPDERRLENRTDLNDRVVKQKAASTLAMYKNAVQSIVLYSETFLMTIPGQVGHALEFFKDSGPLPDNKYVRSWLIWYCDGAEGILDRKRLRTAKSAPDAKVSVRTVVTMLQSLNGALCYFNQPITSGLWRENHIWIKNVLAKEQNLNLFKKEKPVAYAKDVTLIIRKLWSRENMHLFSASLRQHFYLTLAINLLMDCSIRVGEIAVSPQEVQQPDQTLQWGDIKMYAFPRENDGIGFNLYTIVTWRWQKGRKLEPDDNKESALHALPPRLILEDSATQLLLLAILERHLADFDSYENLMNAKPNVDGSLIRIRNSSLKLPVFRRVSTYDGLTALPLQQPFIQNRLPQLGESAGFDKRFQTYALRRGAFYYLQSTQSERTVARHMGWRGASANYPWEEYEGDVLTTDTQSIRHGLAIDSSLHNLASIGLARVQEGTTRISDAGLEEVGAHPKVIRAKANADALRTQISDQYGTVAAARNAASPLHREWLLAQNRSDQTYRAQALLVYRDEYRERTQSTYLKPSGGSEETQEAMDASDETESMHQEVLYETQLLTTQAGKVTVEEVLRQDATHEENQFGTVNISGNDEERNLEQQAATSATELLDLDEADRNAPHAGEQSVEESLPSDDHARPLGNHRDATFCAHALYDRGTSLTSITGDVRLAWYSTQLTTMDSLYELFRQPDISRQNADTMLLDFYRSEVATHTIGPQHSILDDTSCNSDATSAAPFATTRSTHASSITPDTGMAAGTQHESNADQLDVPKNVGGKRRHVLACARNAISQRANDAVTTYLQLQANTTCNVKKGRDLAECGATQEDPKEMHEHRFFHFKATGNKALLCRFQPCASQATPFRCLEDLKLHMVETHGLAMPSDSRSLETAFWFWCEFCEDAILLAQSSQAARDHAKDHYQDAKALVRAAGFLTITVGHHDIKKSRGQTQTVVKPALCPICLPNASLPWEIRMRCYMETRHYRIHMVLEHFDASGCGPNYVRYVEPYAEDATHFCAGSISSDTDFVYCHYDAPMTRAELSEHMDHVHGAGNPLSWVTERKASAKPRKTHEEVTLALKARKFGAKDKGKGKRDAPEEGRAQSVTRDAGITDVGEQVSKPQTAKGMRQRKPSESTLNQAEAVEQSSTPQVNEQPGKRKRKADTNDIDAADAANLSSTTQNAPNGRKSRLKYRVFEDSESDTVPTGTDTTHAATQTSTHALQPLPHNTPRSIRRRNIEDFDSSPRRK